jgi:predicted alpha/beta superfamily hydrolase
MGARQVCFVSLSMAAMLVVSQPVAGRDSASVKAGAVQIGQRYKMYSNALKEPRTYLVHKPTRYEFSKQKYPVLILLDGADHFEHTSATVEFLASIGRIPQMIVVAIPNTDRRRDMTPPIASAAAQGGTGGANEFLSFIGDELLPEIERRYRTVPYRVIAGHSLGGLTAVHSLVKRPALFNGYLVMSPSLWWDEQAPVKAAAAYLSANPEVKADFYMTLGAEGEGMLSGAWRLASHLEELAPKSLRWKFVRSPEESHGSIPHRSTYDGLQFLFDGWDFGSLAAYDQMGLAGIEASYAKLSERLGFQVPMPDSTTGGLFFALLGEKRYADAEAVLKRGVELFPNVSDVYAGAGYLYDAQKNEPKAIENWKQVLRMYPGSMQARQRLTDYKVDFSAIVSEPKLTEKALRAVAGNYRVADLELDITYEEGKLFATSDSGRFEIRALSDSTFYYVNADVEVEFVKDGRGRVTRMKMDRFGEGYEYARVTN